MALEWSEELPFSWRAEQAFIIGDVAYFSNFGSTLGGSPATPIIAALDLDTRELLWQIEQDPLAAMTHDDQRLFALTDQGIVAISLIGGTVLWHTTPGPEVRRGRPGAIVAGGGLLFYDPRTATGDLYALDARSGEVAWSTSLGVPTGWFEPSAGPIHWDRYGALSFDRGTLYVGTTMDLSSERFEFALLALSAEDGHRLWDFPFATRTTRGDSPPGAASLPAFGEQALYFGTWDGFSYALRRDTGEVLWKREVGLDFCPVYVQDQIVSISGYQTVGAVDAGTGGLRWAVPILQGEIGSLSSFVFLGDSLVFYSAGPHRSQLSVIDLESGEATFTLRPDIPPDYRRLDPRAFAAHGDRLYLVTMNCIHAFRVSWGDR